MNGHDGIVNHLGYRVLWLHRHGIDVAFFEPIIELFGWVLIVPPLRSERLIGRLLVWGEPSIPVKQVLDDGVWAPIGLIAVNTNLIAVGSALDFFGTALFIIWVTVHLQYPVL